MPTTSSREYNRLERAVHRLLHRGRAKHARGLVEEVVIDVNQSLAHRAEYIQTRASKIYDERQGRLYRKSACSQ